MTIRFWDQLRTDTAGLRPSLGYLARLGTHSPTRMELDTLIDDPSRPGTAPYLPMLPKRNLPLKARLRVLFLIRIPGTESSTLNICYK